MRLKKQNIYIIAHICTQYCCPCFSSYLNEFYKTVNTSICLGRLIYKIKNESQLIWDMRKINCGNRCFPLLQPPSFTS